MRCNNCGWNNPDGATKCVKCNQILDSKSSVLDWTPRLETESAESIITCEKCGYQLVGDVSVCPECGCQMESNRTFPSKGKPNTRATVKDVKATKLDNAGLETKLDPRETVVDASLQESGAKKTVISEVKTYSYKLLAIDRPVVDTKGHGAAPMAAIEMKCSAELDLKLNEVVLIGGLRFTRIE